jgi:ankyrin repeat protein
MGTATLKMLIDHGADVNYVSKRFVTPLYHAVRRNKMAKLKLLLECGADPNVKYLNSNTTALSYAKVHGRTEFYNLIEAACCKKLP